MKCTKKQAYAAHESFKVKKDLTFCLLPIMHYCLSSCVSSLNFLVNFSFLTQPYQYPTCFPGIQLSISLLYSGSQHMLHKGILQSMQTYFML